MQDLQTQINTLINDEAFDPLLRSYLKDTLSDPELPDEDKEFIIQSLNALKQRKITRVKNMIPKIRQAYAKYRDKINNSDKIRPERKQELINKSYESENSYIQLLESAME